MLLPSLLVRCGCADCRGKPCGQCLISCTEFEAHGGRGASKKWKQSIRVRPGGVPEVPLGGEPIKWEAAF